MTFLIMRQQKQFSRYILQTQSFSVEISMSSIPALLAMVVKNIRYLTVNYRVRNWILLSGSCGESGAMSK